MGLPRDVRYAIFQEFNQVELHVLRFVSKESSALASDYARDKRLEFLWGRANHVFLSLVVQRRNLSVLQWAFNLVRTNVTVSVMHDVMKYGSLEMYLWAISVRFPWDPSFVDKAAMAGNVDVLQYVINNTGWQNFPKEVQNRCLEYAAKDGSLEMLQFFADKISQHKTQTQIPSSCWDTAMQKASTELVLFLVENKVRPPTNGFAVPPKNFDFYLWCIQNKYLTYSDGIMRSAISLEDTDFLEKLFALKVDFSQFMENALLHRAWKCLKWGHSVGLSWGNITCTRIPDKEMVVWAGDNGCPLGDGLCAHVAWNLPTLQWARGKGCPWDIRTTKILAQTSNINGIAWARSCDPPIEWSAEVYAGAIVSPKMVQYLHENGCPWDSRCVIYALERTLTYYDARQSLAYLVKNGCPLNAAEITSILVKTGDSDSFKLIVDHGCKFDYNDLIKKIIQTRSVDPRSFCETALKKGWGSNEEKEQFLLNLVEFW
jgi:hypothetical protein